MRSRGTAVVVDVAWRAALFGLIWLVISGFEKGALVFGAIATAAALAVSLYLRPPPTARPPVVQGARFLAMALRAVAEGGYLVARRALLPRGRVADPGYVRHRVEGAEDAGLRALAYARTLSPGTAAARLEEDGLELHALDRERGRRRPGLLEETARAIGRRKAERTAAWKR